MPIWTGGTLAIVNDYRSEAPEIQVFDKSGKELFRHRVTIPGARLINVYSGMFARGADGSLAVIGTAYSDDSRGTTFLNVISADRRQQTVVRVASFFPQTVTVAADGTIWTAGRETWDESREKDPNHRVIRHFDKAGRLLNASVPRSSLSIDAAAVHPADASHVVSSKDRIGWYSPASHTYIEFSLQGVETRRYSTVPVFPEKMVNGIALCDDGSLFVSAVGKSEWTIFALNRETGAWNQIPRAERWGSLYGCEGTTLAATTNVPMITWLEPRRAIDPTMRGQQARTFEGDLRKKRADTLVRTIEEQYGVDLGVRGDMKLGTLRKPVGEDELAKVIAKAQKP